MSKRAFNLGCGPEVFKDGYKGYDRWRNVDSVYKHEDVENIDLRYDIPLVGEGWDFVLVNHVLCTMKPQEVDMFLRNAYDLLQDGGKIEVIDVDMMKAFASYFMNEGADLPIDDHMDKDYRLCMHLSGFGTRLSLYTTMRMVEVLQHAGFYDVTIESVSEFDTRPKESLIVTGVKNGSSKTILTR